MNNEYLNQQPDNFDWDKPELSPYQVIAILIGLGLFVWAAYEWFNRSTPKLGHVANGATKMSASEIAALLNS